MKSVANICRLFLLPLSFSSYLNAQTTTNAPTTPSRNSVANGSVVAKVSQGFPAQYQIDNVKLSLNGSGIRYKAIFKVYSMAMYMPSKVSTLEQTINMAGPKRLQFVALRDIPTADLGLMFYRGLKDNSPSDLYLRHTVEAARMSEIASGRAKIAAGESFAMDFIPGKGTTFYIADQAQGAPLGDAEFFSMILRIWLGNVPADFMLKDALLGISSKAGSW